MYLSEGERFLLLGLVILFAVKQINITFYDNLTIFRYYFGFVIFYFYFKLSGFRIDYKLLFWMTVIITTLDWLLINTVLPLEMMKNIPKEHVETILMDKQSWIFFRSYGLASSPTASATILVVLLSSIYIQDKDHFNNFLILICLFPLILLGSGSGFFLFMLFIIIRFKLYKNAKVFIGLLSILMLILYVQTQDINERSVFSRLSVNYISHLYDLKTYQVIEVLHTIGNSSFEVLFGCSYSQNDNLRIMSDFGWIDFLECCGIVGVLFFIIFIWIKKKIVFLPVLIFLLGYFHYPALCSIPGQILFASFMIWNKNE